MYVKFLSRGLSLPFLANGLRQYLITGHDCLPPRPSEIGNYQTRTIWRNWLNSTYNKRDENLSQSDEVIFLKECLKKSTRLNTINGDNIKDLYMFTARGKILLGLNRIRDRMLKHGLRKSVLNCYEWGRWCFCIPHKLMIVSETVLRGGPEKDKSCLSFRKLFLSFFFIFCPSVVLRYVHAWNVSLGSRRFHLLIPRPSVRCRCKAVVKTG
jgi:hypothetical protein